MYYWNNLSLSFHKLIESKNKWEIKMEFGYFKKPVIKKTTKCIPISNKEEITIGFIKRFYTNKVEKLIDHIFDEFYVNVEVMDSNSNCKGY
nr:HIRAN domain-containing protein [Bacillus sp. YKCMOAS1]